jgi:hypothetical protein
VYDLTPSSLMDWDQQRARLEEIATGGSQVSDEDRRVYNLTVTLPHPDYPSVRTVLQRVAYGHQSSGPTRRRVLGIDGDFKSGKSELVLRFAMELSRTIWGDQGREVVEEGLNTQVIPAFIANASASGEADLMRSISKALGLPSPARSDTAVQILDRVAAQCRRSRTHYGFIDDANMLATSRRQEHLTQFLKRMVNELPVTLVFVGHRLEQSPVLRAVTHMKADTDAANQIGRRMTRVTVKTFTDQGEDPKSFVATVRAAAREFLLIDADPLRDLRPRDYAWLLEQTAGRVGDLFELLSLAAHDAVGLEERLTPHLLRRAHERLYPVSL